MPHTLSSPLYRLTFYRPSLVLCFVLSLCYLTAANADDTELYDAYELHELSDDAFVCEDDDQLPEGFYYKEYTTDCQYNENLTAVTNDEVQGFADKDGNMIIAATFEEVHNFDEGLALVKQEGKYGYINAKGKFVIKPTFEDAWSFWEGRAKIAQNGKYGFIDKSGKIIIKPAFDETGNWFEDGLVSVKVGKSWGFIDKNGQTKIAPTFDYAEDFSEQLAVVGKTTGKTDESGEPIYQYGYINPKGKIVLPLKYDIATAFLNGSAMVSANDSLYFINKKGERVEPEF